jgi:branched-chain amino acid transport system ATP-binding protein
MLQTRQLTKRFGAFTAVEDVDFELGAGETQSIIGPNGAGKTTFFGMLSGTYEPTAGTIHLRGEDVTGLGPNEIAKQGLSRSFQITNLFDDLTVLENIRLGIQSVTRKPYSWRYLFTKVGDDDDLNERAREIADRVGLSEVVDKPVNELSHGNKRNLEVGVTASLGSDVLLFDEPAAGLTTEETHELLEIIESLAEGRAVLLIEHDMDFVMEISEKITVLHQGRTLAAGSPEEIQENREVRRIYMGEDDA